MRIIKWKHEYSVVIAFLLTKLLLTGFVNYKIFANVMCLLHIASAILLVVVWFDKLFNKQLFGAVFIAFIGMFVEQLFKYEYWDSNSSPLYELIWKIAGCIGLLLLVLVFCKCWDKKDRMAAVMDAVATLVVIGVIFTETMFSINTVMTGEPVEVEYEVTGEGEYEPRYKRTYPVEPLDKTDACFESLSVTDVYELLPGDKIIIEYREGLFFDIYKVVRLEPERFAED